MADLKGVLTYDITGDIILAMNKEKRLAEIRNNPKNVRFTDLVAAALSVGFVVARQNGSHTVLKNDAVREILNLQDVGGKAKPYQVKQFLGLLDAYGLQ